MAQDPLHVLWVEPSFPGRLGAVADWLVRRRGYRSWFYCHTLEPRENWPASVGQGLEVQVFGVGGVARESAVTWSRALERSLCYAYGCWEVLEQKRPRPIDLIVGRSAGLGSALFAPVYDRAAPVVQFLDYYYHGRANDLADEAGPETPAAYFHWRRSMAAIELLDLEQAALGWTPTDWQRGLFPAEYRDDFLVLHDGVDTRRFARSPWHAAGKGARTIAGRTIPDATRVVTFVARIARPAPGVRPVPGGGRRRAPGPARRPGRGGGRPDRPPGAGRRLPQQGLLRAPDGAAAAGGPRAPLVPGRGPADDGGRGPGGQRPARRAGPGLSGRAVHARGHGRRLRGAGLRHRAAPRGHHARRDGAAGGRRRRRGDGPAGAGRAGRPGRPPAARRRRGRIGAPERSARTPASPASPSGSTGWRSPAGGPRERPVHPRRLPRPVRPARARSWPRGTAGSASSWCRASRAARPRRPRC